MKKWLSVVVGFIVSFGLIYLLVGQDIDAVWDELSRARHIYLLPTGILLIISLLTRAIRWHFLLNRQVSVWHSFHITNVGYFLSGILPLRIGDVARAWMTTRLNEPVAAFTAISTIVVERLLDLLALLIMLGMMLVLLDVPTELASAGALVALVAFLGGIILAGLAAKPQWAFHILDRLIEWFPILKRLDLHNRLQHFVDGIQPMSNPQVAFSALLWTGVSWFFSLAAGYVLLFMMFDVPTLAATVSLIVLATVSVAIPAVPGSLGPFEGAVVGGLWIGGMIPSATSPDNAPAVALGVALHALTLTIYVTLGLIGLSIEQASIRQVTEGAQEFVHQEQAESPSTNKTMRSVDMAQESVS